MITTDQILDCFDYWLVVDADQNIVAECKNQSDYVLKPGETFIKSAVAENLMLGFAMLAQLLAVTFNDLQAQIDALKQTP